MHNKAAEYANRTGTSYAIKGLRTDRGTLVDGEPRPSSSGYRRHVVGRASRGCGSFGATSNRRKRRMETELEMFRRVADAKISIDQVTINQAGVAFVVDGDRGNELRASARRSQPRRSRARRRARNSRSSARACGAPGRRAPRRRCALACRRRNHSLHRQQRHDLGPGAGRPGDDAPSVRCTNTSSLDKGETVVMNLGAILTAMVTPFDERGELDLGEARRSRALAGRSRKRRARRRGIDRRRADARRAKSASLCGRP